ncbi:MAG: hypothetical protein PVI31_10710 [Gemmatimonadota bacterium]
MRIGWWAHGRRCRRVGRGVALWFAVLAVALAASATPVAAQATLRTTVDTTVITVGDRVTMTISVEHASGASLQLADSVDAAPFEILDARALPDETVEDGVRSTLELTFTAFELGELQIPPVTVDLVAADGTVEPLETDRYGIEVVSVGADESGDIRGIRGPLSIPISSWVIALWLIVPLLVAVILYFVARRFRSRADDAPRPALGPLPRPPHEVALEALASLEESPLLEQGRVKEYHIAASDILRTYVEGRFRVEALEMTTREVLDGLAEVGADPSFRVGLRTFLEACDVVKFAKGRPSAQESLAVLELGRRIILESATSSTPGVDASEPAPEPGEGDALVQDEDSDEPPRVTAESGRGAD